MPSKENLLADLTRNREDWMNTFAQLSEDQISKSQIHDEWTLKDIVGHISYWEQITLDHLRESLTEGRPRPLSNTDPEDSINARQWKNRRSWQWSRVRAEFENTRRALLDRVTSLSDSELAFFVPKPWWNQSGFYSLAELIQQDALEHSREHLEEIQRWLAMTRERV